jgi:hemoglobin
VNSGAATETRPAGDVDSTPYERIGGAAALRRITERFYDIMSEAPEVGIVRAMHSGDLAPMRQKLFEFMSGWLGGPNLYFERSDRKCMGAAHAPFVIGETERDQWLYCMRRAMQDQDVDPQLREHIDRALYRMADMLRSS